MKRTESHTKAIAAVTYSKWDDYKMLVKVKLSAVVVITSLLSFAIASGSSFSWASFALLGLGGFLVTGAANAINQVLEKDYDKLMSRTMMRPITTGRMKGSEAVMFAGVSLLLGITLLSVFNPVTSFLGMLSFVMYAFVYTPLKRYSTAAVAVGAIPGALPVLIGCTAAEGTVTAFALSLFVIQFLWQFPHFWAIGYLAYDDYDKAGYKLMPGDDQGVRRNLGMSAFFYALLIIPVVAGTYVLGAASALTIAIVMGATFVYAIYAWRFHTLFDRSSARSLMFCSFFYMPVVLLAYLTL